jgi:transposase
LSIGELDRFELDQTLAQWEVLDGEVTKVETRIRERAQRNENALLSATLYGGAPGYAALALAARIGPIDRFPTAAKSGQLLGPDTDLPELRGSNSAAGLD